MLFPAVPLFSLSSFFCLNIALIPPTLSSGHLSVSRGDARIAIASAWLSLAARPGSCSLCGHSPAVLAIHNLYTCAHTHTQEHTACTTHSIHCPGATPDFKLQLAEPEAKLNLEGSSVEVTQPGNNCLSHIFPVDGCVSPCWCLCAQYRMVRKHERGSDMLMHTVGFKSTSAAQKCTRWI